MKKTIILLLTAVLFIQGSFFNVLTTAFAENERPNLAMNKKTEVSSTGGASGIMPENLNDGDLETRWVPEEKSLWWAIIDLEEEVTFDTVFFRVANYGNDPIKNYKIEVSSDKDEWQTAYEVTDGTNLSNGTEKNISFAAVTGRYIRFSVSNESSAGLYEFQVSYSVLSIDEVAEIIKSSVSIPDMIFSPVELPSASGDYELTWESDNSDVIEIYDNTKMNINRSSEDVSVNLTASFEYMSEVGTIIFPVTVKGITETDEQKIVDLDYDSLNFSDVDNSQQKLYLPTIGENGSDITWETDGQLLLTDGTILWDTIKDFSTVECSFKAHISYGTVSRTKNFTIFLKDITPFEEVDTIMSDEEFYGEWDTETRSWITEPKYSEVIVHNRISNFVGQNISFYLMSYDKEDAAAVLSTRESVENPPKLIISVNDTEREYTATADTYVRMGKYRDSNYGSETQMYVKDFGAPSDDNDNTFISMVKFDLSDIKSTDKIGNARLLIYGQSDDPDVKKELMVMTYMDNAWDESKINFSGCAFETINWRGIPGGFDYNRIGYGYNREYYYNMFRFNYLTDFTAAYQKTKNEYYIWNGIDIFLDFLRDRGAGTPRSLEPGLRGQTIPPLYLMWTKTQSMTPAVSSSMLKYIYKEAKYLEGRFDGDSNFGQSQEEGFYIITKVFPEFYETDDWLDLIEERAGYLLEHQINDDGSFQEDTLGYATGAFTFLQMCVELPNLSEELENRIRLFIKKWLGQ